MFDHLGVVVTDLKCSARLYAYMLAPLGFRILEKHRTSPGEGWVVIGTGEPASPFLVIDAGRPSFWPEQATVNASPIHLCFRAPSQDSMEPFTAWGWRTAGRTMARRVSAVGRFSALFSAISAGITSKPAVICYVTAISQGLRQGPPVFLDLGPIRNHVIVCYRSRKTPRRQGEVPWILWNGP